MRKRFFTLTIVACALAVVLLAALVLYLPASWIGDIRPTPDAVEYAVTAQRLARRLCENCKAPADYPREAMLKAGFKGEDLDCNWKPFRAVGCSSCTNGYKGRVGIYQVMPISEDIQKIILNEGTSMDIANQAQRENVRDLRQSGLIKVRSGMTTLEEVISVTNE